MSGRKYFLKQEARRKAMERIKESGVAKNRDMARQALQKLIIDFAGWKGLDEWAKAVLDRLEKGETIDLKKLKDDVQAWRKEHGMPEQEGEQ